MPRTWIVGAAIALMATPALAAPGFGSSLRAGGDTSTHAQAGDESVIATLLSLFNIKFEKNAKLEKSVVNPTSDPAGDPRARKECDQEKQAAEAEKVAEAKKQKPAGPEPVYLAF